MKNQNNNNTLLSKYVLYVIFSLYFIYIFGFYFFSQYISNFISISDLKMGYILGGDSSTYIQGAKDLTNFQFPTVKATSYLGYIFFLSIFEYFKLDLTFVVLSQIFLTSLSAICIYNISKKISSHWAAVLVLSLYLFYLPLQIWNFYILTETIFVCLIIFILYFLLFFKKRYLPILIILIIFYIALKPHGIILVPSLIMSLLIWLYIQKRSKLIFLSLGIILICLYPIFLLLNLYLLNDNFVNSIVERGIIWGYQDENNFLKYKMPSENENDLRSLLKFINNNFNLTLVAFFKKIWFFIFRIRPYYSDFHNYYIVFLNMIYLPLALIGFFKLVKKKNIGIILMYFLLFFFTLAVGLSWADTDGRFSLYVIPIIFIFAGHGYHMIFKATRNILGF